LEKQTVLQTGSSATAVTPLPPPVPPPPSSPPAPPTPPTPPKNLDNDSAPATPLTEDYENMEIIPSVPMLTGLDHVLEEVGMVPNGAPPPPPNRYSVQDVHQKFQKPPELPDQIKNLIDEVARRPSPAPEANERRMDLERRQERLAEKQRQLRSQFQQLKQMTPLS
uniref:Mediator of RNA polymerase II transcription subunit 9 n=1 Tax=Angiostrongylus cantonensis TaxID=6313 RepID=A0A0K0DE71_ANGCA